MNIIYEAVVGSKLKGNDTPESDTDSVGIFIAKNEEIGGFDWNVSKETVTNASPEDDDYTYFEIRKFLRLAAKSTPAILPFLSSDLVMNFTSIGITALNEARDLVSEEFLRKNHYYVGGKWIQYKESLDAGKPKPKELVEAYHIGELTCRWLAEGFAPRSAMLDYEIFYSGKTFEQFVTLPISEQETAIAYLCNVIMSMPAHPLLTKEPNMKMASDFLSYVRNNHG